MKKSIMMMGLLAMGLTFTSCGDDDNNTKVIPEGTDDVAVELDDSEVNAENVNNWVAYAEKVAMLLQNDATTLLDDWSISYDGGHSYATQFVNHEGSYKSAAGCIEQIVDGCIDISNEVGSTKIGDPRDKWENGKYTEAVYAVESWYSYHSIDDYTNNIISIRNAFNGTRTTTEAQHSIASYLKAHNNSLYTETKQAITNAINAIQGMAAPFRSHIGNASVLVAEDACASLNSVLTNKVKPVFTDNEDAELDNIVKTYVTDVVLPTYTDLKAKNTALHVAVTALKNNPTSANFKTAANAWMAAREPWETSEAFLFGPVDKEGLDPNMDSWPLDQDAIDNIIKTGNFDALDIKDGASDEEVENAQNVRGFHTLEYLLFKDGNPRTYNK